MVQNAKELDQFYQINDPWEYEGNPEDEKRKKTLLDNLPERSYSKVLDIGCGHGYVTRDLPGEQILGVDYSEEAISFAKKQTKINLDYQVMSIFDVNQLNQQFDLIVITGVLYPQYIGAASLLIRDKIDQILAPRGILALVHITDWYYAKFPYNLLSKTTYPYREYTHFLEIYSK